MHLVHVEGNMKLGVSADLGPRVLVEGPNGSGKTSLLAAVELLLTGACGGGSGRKPTKLPARLVALATAGEKALNLRGTLSDGSEVVFRAAGKSMWSRSGAVVEKPIGVCLSTVLSDLLAGDPTQTLRPELIRVACANVDVANMAADRVPEVYRDVWNVAWRQALAESSSPADALADCARRLRAGMREANAGARAVESAVAADGEKEEAPTDEEVEAARKLVEVARRYEQVQVQHAALTADITRLRKALGNAPDCSDFSLALAACDGALAVQEFWASKEFEKATCLACGGAVRAEDVPKLIERLRAKADALREKSAKAVEQVRVRSNLRAAEAQLARLPELSARACSASEATERLEALLRRKGAAESRREIRRSAARYQHEAQAYKALSEAADAMVREALDGSIRGLEAWVNRHLANGEVRFVLFEDGKPACRVMWAGTVRQSKVVAPLPALSGAQQADVVRAFACAWAASSSAEVTLVAVDDVGLDKVHLTAMLDGLDMTDDGAGPSQAIVCNVHGYKIEREGWTNVRL